MSIQDDFLTIQKNWIARTILDRKTQLKEAEDIEDYEQCHEIKQSLDRGMKIVNGMLKVDQIILDCPYTYPRLMFELFDIFNKLTKKLDKERLVQKGAEAYTFRFGSHIYDTVRIDRYHPDTKEEYVLQPALDVKNPKYPNCGSVEGEYIYIIEKVCTCDENPSTLYEMADDMVLNCINAFEKTYKEKLTNLNSIQ